MFIIFDCALHKNGIPAGYQGFDTGPNNDLLVNDPADQTKQISAMSYLRYLSSNPQMHEQAGYAVISQLPGLPQGTTRWQALVNSANAATASPVVQALQLK